MILMRKEAENVPWLMCASRGRRKSAPERFCFAESALARESRATKKPGKPGFFGRFRKDRNGIWCPEEDSNLHTLSSTST